MNESPSYGPVYKVIRLVATSADSWEDAARRGVRESAKTIVDLEGAKVTEMDVLVDENEVRRYRVKLEVVFQFDRSRPVPGSDEFVRVRRYLIVANQTLVSHALHELVDEKVAAGPAEFHILAPQARRSLPSFVGDPLSGFIDSHAAETQQELDDIDRREAGERLATFRHVFSGLGRSLTGEVGVGDPVAAVRRAMERSTFDEIIVSTLPPGVSRWLKRDLSSRLERAFSIPVTSLLHDEGSDITACPIG